MAKKKVKNFTKYIIWFWGISLGTFSLIILLFLSASWGGLGALPTFEELENPENNLATEVISSDGKTLGKYATENRTPIKFKDLPQNIIEALVATKMNGFTNILVSILEAQQGLF